MFTLLFFPDFKSLYIHLVTVSITQAYDFLKKRINAKLNS